jgi:hypothetical protein
LDVPESNLIQIFFHNGSAFSIIAGIRWGGGESSGQLPIFKGGENINLSGDKQLFILEIFFNILGI